ncbi:MAG TPA: GTP 3',8-cyclase MoaA [Vicinamibacterales bacterium]|jgi:cyclic pyranopterin phosphate synthase|nr:GTP 3',8-cyclase MoaA [Vicinamibacterales bacterium]
MKSMVPTDRFGRPLRSLRLSVTDRCNLRCQYCMPEPDYVWLPRENLLTFEECSAIVDAFTDLGVDRVRLTGGEPLLRRNLANLIAGLASRPAIRDLALTTNGLLLDAQAASLRDAGLHRITVSLDTLRRDRFRTLTRFDSLHDVIAGIDAASAAGFKNIKIDTVVMRGINDDELVDLLEFGRTRQAEVRFIEYMDVGGATHWSPESVFSRADILHRLAAHYGPVEPILETTSAPADRFMLADGLVFGIISSTTEPFCDTCDRSRLTADGIWLMCLYARAGTDLRRPLRAGASRDELSGLIRTVWSSRADRGAEERLMADRRVSLIPVSALKKDAHLEMHTRGG